MPVIHVHLHRRTRDYAPGSEGDRLRQRTDRLKAAGVDVSDIEKALRTNNYAAAGIMLNKLEVAARRPQDKKRKAKDEYLSATDPQIKEKLKRIIFEEDPESAKYKSAVRWLKQLGG
jgi:DNA-binding transcriptional MerR regulator